MADEKLTQQTETTDINDDDIIYVVRDPATVPISRKMKFSNLVFEFPDASETVEGKVELATTDEAIALTDTARAVTPAGVGAAIVENAGGAFLASATFSSTDTYTFSTSDFPGSYEHLLIRGWDLYSSCDHTYIGVRFNADSGNNYSYFNSSVGAAGTTIDDGANTVSAARIFVGDGLRSNNTAPASFELKILNYAGAALYKAYFGNIVTVGVYGGTTAGGWASASPITSITFFPAANTMTGTIAIYGFNT